MFKKALFISLLVTIMLLITSCSGSSNSIRLTQKVKPTQGWDLKEVLPLLEQKGFAVLESNDLGLAFSSLYADNENCVFSLDVAINEEKTEFRQNQTYDRQYETYAQIPENSTIIEHKIRPITIEPGEKKYFLQIDYTSPDVIGISATHTLLTPNHATLSVNYYCNSDTELNRTLYNNVFDSIVFKSNSPIE